MEVFKIFLEKWGLWEGVSFNLLEDFLCEKFIHIFGQLFC